VYRLLYDGPLLCGFNYLHRSRELDASTQQSDGDIVTLANRGRTANAVNEYTHKYPTHVAWIITTSDHIGPHRTWTEHLELEITRLVGRIGSGVQVRASFQKTARLMGRLGSRVGYILVSSNFQKNARVLSRLGSGPRLVGRIGSGVQVRASFQKSPPSGSVKSQDDWLHVCVIKTRTLFDVWMNLYGSYAVVSRSSAQFRSGVGPMQSDAVISHTTHTSPSPSPSRRKVQRCRPPTTPSWVGATRRRESCTWC